MTNKVILAGGTGFIGQYVKQQYEELGYEVTVVSRGDGHVSWDHQSLVKALEGSTLLINLAGKSVNCRYHEKNKQKIFSSRTETTEMLGKAVLACERPPALWVNSSTATIYRHAEDRPMSEENGEIGSGFSVEVAKAWERAFFQFELPKTRQVALRISIVLGKGGGVMIPFLNLAKAGLGGKQGNGHQKFSWIHIEDLFRIIRFVEEKEELEGVFNCSTQDVISNEAFMKAVRESVGRRIGLPSPRWLLEIGAVIIRTETELMLKSRWVTPDRLVEEGFTFHYGTIDEALKEIVT